MRLVFKEINIKNFLSFSEQSFDFSKYNGINLICGNNLDIPENRNGAGKTALIAAVTYCVFGQLINPLENEKIPNRYLPLGEKTEVILELESDGVLYKIIRGLTGKTKKSGFLYVYKFNNESGKYEDITKASIKETQKLIIRNIMCCDMSIFLRSTLLTADQAYNFFKLDKAAKTEFIEQIFNLKIFGTMYDLIHKDILKFDKEFFGAVQSLKTIEDSVNTNKDNIVKYDQNKATKLVEYKTSIDQYTSQLNQFVEECNKKRTLICENVNTQDEIDTLNARYKEIQEKISETTEKYNEYLEKKNKVDSKKHEIVTIQNKEKTSIEFNKKAIEKHNDTLAMLCSDCTAKFDAKYNLTELKKKNEHSSSIIEKCNENLGKLDKIYSEINEKMKEFPNAIKTYKQELSEITVNVARLEKQKNQVAEFDNSVNSKKIEFENKIKTIKNYMEVEENKVNPYIENLKDIQEKYDTKKKEVDELNDKITHYKYVENIVSPNVIKRIIIKDLISSLNNRIQHYMAKIGSTFTCIFDEDLNYKFITESGEAGYNNFSAGEKMRISIATGFAFRDFMSIRNNINANILALDEYIDGGLDSASVKNIMDILKEFSIIEKTNIFIVSHRQEIAGCNFNKTITVQKQNGISTILV